VRGYEEGCIVADHGCTVNFVNARYKYPERSVHLMHREHKM